MQAEEPKDTPVAKLIDLGDLKPNGKGRAAKPTGIANAEELAKAFPDAKVRDGIAKQVDFARQQLVYFSWSGSGQDKIAAKEGEKKDEIVFEYKRGLTRDLRRHHKLYLLPKDATWKVNDTR